MDSAWTPYITSAAALVPPAALWIAMQVFQTKADAAKEKDRQAEADKENTAKLHALDMAIQEIHASIHASVHDSAQEVKAGFNAANSLLRADFFAEMERDRNLNREQTRETQGMIRELMTFVQRLDKTVAVVKSEAKNKSRSDDDSEVDA
jgi:hypothetical protein